MRATKLTVLHDDERQFDVDVVHSAVAFLNERASKKSWEERCRHFRWIERKLKKLARNTSISLEALGTFSTERPEVTKPNGSVETEQETLSRLGSLFLAGLSNIQGRKTDAARIVQAHVWKKSADEVYQLGSYRASADKWLDEVLARVEFVTRFHRTDRRRVRITLPKLESLEQALVYALDVLDENRWDLRHRVRRCPYDEQPLRDDRGREIFDVVGHWFLDYRLDEDGVLPSGRAQRFCRPAHANAFRQRQYRKRARQQPKTQK